MKSCLGPSVLSAPLHPLHGALGTGPTAYFPTPSPARSLSMQLSLASCPGPSCPAATPGLHWPKAPHCHFWVVWHQEG